MLILYLCLISNTNLFFSHFSTFMKMVQVLEMAEQWETALKALLVTNVSQMEHAMSVGYFPIKLRDVIYSQLLQYVTQINPQLELKPHTTPQKKQNV